MAGKPPDAGGKRDRIIPKECRDDGIDTVQRSRRVSSSPKEVLREAAGHVARPLGGADRGQPSTTRSFTCSADSKHFPHAHGQYSSADAGHCSAAFETVDHAWAVSSSSRADINYSSNTSSFRRIPLRRSMTVLLSAPNV